MKAFKKNHNAPEQQAMLGKGLAASWSEIEQADLKVRVLALIKAYWLENGGWEPFSGSRKKAYKIYTGEV